MVNGIYKPTYSWGAPSCVVRIGFDSSTCGYFLHFGAEIGLRWVVTTGTLQ